MKAREEQHTLSVSERAYLRAAVSRSTRKAYNTAEKNYMKFMRDEKYPDYGITAGRVARWITALADAGQHTGGTIAVYLSAISTWWTERTAGDTDDAHNPTRVGWVQRILTGIKNAKAEVDQRHREERYAQPLMMATVVKLGQKLDLRIRTNLTVFAAAALGVAAVLRPNALLGSAVYRERGVMCEHIEFFSATESPIRRPSVGEPNIPPGENSYLTLFIPIDKTDQKREGSTLFIGATTAVQAVWKLWSTAPEKGRLFRQPSGDPLTSEALVKSLKIGLRQINYKYADSFTAKCFRRGGASTLAETGASGDAIAAAGVWSKSAKTYNRYIGQESHRKQQLKDSRNMEVA